MPPATRLGSAAALPGPPQDALDAFAGLCSARCERAEVNIYCIFCSDREQFSVPWDCFLAASFLLISSLLFSCFSRLCLPKSKFRTLEKEVSVAYPKPFWGKKGGKLYFRRACYTLGLSLHPSEVLRSPSLQRGIRGSERGCHRLVLAPP